MVEYTGKRSAASVIKTLLGIAFYLGLVAGAAVIGWQIYLLAAEPAWLKEGMELQIETPGLVFIFHEGLDDSNIPLLFKYQFVLVLPLLALALLIIYQLRKIFDTLVEKTPFTKGNSLRIRIIGAAVIAAGILKAIIHVIIGAYLAGRVSLPGLELKGNLRFEDLIGGILTGLIILVLAEVFSYGARLQEEQDFTV